MTLPGYIKLNNIIPEYYMYNIYISISRFITRTSYEKQLALNLEQTIGISNLLLTFLRSHGRSCRRDSITKNSTSSSNMDNIVTHEVQYYIYL